MRIKITTLIILAASLTAIGQEKSKIEIVLLGTLHFQQFHNPENAPQDFLSDKRQKEFDEVADKLASFQPDAIFVEREPASQKKLDSLYQLPLKEAGLSEVFQIGFRLAKKLNHSAVYGIDFYESTSQGLLQSGDNIDVFKEALNEFRSIGRSITKEFLSGEMTINEFLIELNRPDKIQLSHRLLYNTPAYVQNGSFSSYEGLSDIDTTHIGAEFISLFYERNLKMYSNILNRQIENNASRIVVIVGQTHVGVLQEMIEKNPDYEIISALDYLEP